MIERTAYLDWLDRWRDRDVIKVITGVRRCGKSTLLEQYRDRLRAEGIPSERMVFLDLESFDNREVAASKDSLYQHVMNLVPPTGRTYVFIDEVQQVPEFEKAVGALFATKSIDLYLTGSNAHLLSGELATLLTGRHVEASILPLSFAEMAPTIAQAGSLDKYYRFARLGSFPFTTTLNEESLVTEYLTGVLNTILTRDVAVRKKVANMGTLFNLVEFMADNIGNLTSAKRIADTMTSMGQKVTMPTIENYLDGLTEAFLLYPVGRYDIRGKRRMERIRKYYLVDPGLRTTLLGNSSPDRGRVLENIVYLELRRRGGRIYVGKLDSAEVDFIVE
ncbi:MAG: ATP-binding protein, partial [Propionibacteriaceae bacterium]|nr:ATP-binding protein [Propionibacteriaceae bacterium]